MVLAKVADADLTSRRSLLEAIRDRLVAELDGDVGHRRSCECKCGVPPDSRTVPTLAKEIRELLKELDSLPVPNASAPADEIAGRRAARRAKAVSE